RYGFRADGPYNPEMGLRFNKNKLLIDPYSLALTGTNIWDKSLYGYDLGSVDEDLSF
ncbi:glycosyl hydrolase (glycogen debranching) protein, partial [mine drainage metagenome]